MMKNEEYWANRSAQRMFEYMQSAEETADQVSKIYWKASKYLTAEMEGIFERFMTKHKLSDQEAIQLLNTMQDKTSIQELIQKLRNSESSEEKEDLLKQLEAPAYQARIERLQQLQSQIDLIMQNVYQQEKDFYTAHFVDLGKDVYYHSVFDIQQKAGFGFSFSKVDENQIERAMNSKWSGENYSARIWNNTRELSQDLKKELLINLITGRTEREVANILAKKFAQGASVSRRLVRTESCFLSNQMEMESYKECGIEKYRYLATLDMRTSKVCRSLDGKVFLVSEQKPGVNCPPMHPWCRSTTTAYVSDQELARMKRRAYNPKTGRTELVPATMNYQEWYEKYVEGKA